MAQKNRNMAAKMLKAQAQRSDFLAEMRAKDAYNYKPMSDQEKLVCCLASKHDIIEIGGRKVRHVETGLTTDKAHKKGLHIARPSIIATHW